jgi:hypothetical protein
MEVVNKLEFHYYFSDDSHNIDAAIRNKCEKELIAIAVEVCKTLNYNPLILSELPAEGGWRDFWTFVDEKPNRVVFMLGVLTLLTGVPTTIYLNHDPDGDARKTELESLQIQKLKLEIDQIQSQRELAQLTKIVADKLSGNMKIVKRKSNLYSQLSGYNKVSKVGLRILNNDFSPASEEVTVERNKFQSFVLNSNKLPPLEIDEAEIELISPVIKEGKFKWKGKYEDETITFNMLDIQFKNSILNQRIPFYTGTSIICNLIIDRELDEVGEVKLKGKSVMTVLDVIYNDTSTETNQGKVHRHAKSMSNNQKDLFT